MTRATILAMAVLVAASGAASAQKPDRNAGLPSLPPTAADIRADQRQRERDAAWHEHMCRVVGSCAPIVPTRR